LPLDSNKGFKDDIVTYTKLVYKDDSNSFFVVGKHDTNLLRCMLDGYLLAAPKIGGYHCHGHFTTFVIKPRMGSDKTGFYSLQAGDIILKLN